MIPLQTRLIVNARRLLPDLSVSVRHVNGRRLRVSLRRQLGLILRGAEKYEPRNAERLRTLIQPRMVAYDAGAQVGFYTMLFSDWVGPEGRVYAFEPDPRNLALLRENTARAAFPNVEIVDRALSDRSSTENFLADTITGATGCLESAPDQNSLTHEWAGIQPNRFRVQTMSLDEFVHLESHPAPDLVKIDVEGSEEKVLTGMSRILTEKRPVVFLEGARHGGSGLSLLERHRYDVEKAECSPDGWPYVAIAKPR